MLKAACFEVPRKRLVRFGFKNAEELARMAFPTAITIMVEQCSTRWAYEVSVLYKK